MAVLCYKNFIDENTTTLTSSGLTNPSNLLSPQLFPKAIITATEWQAKFVFDSIKEVQCIALLGNRVVASNGVASGASESLAVFVDRDFGGGSFGEVSISQIVRIKETPFSEEHVVIFFNSTLETDNIRVTVSSAQLGSNSHEIGSFFAGQFIENDLLTTRQISFQTNDSAQTERSSAGQIYSSSGSSRRAFSISQSAISEDFFQGGADSVSKVNLPSPTLTDVTETSSGVYENTTAGVSGRIAYANALKQNTVYRISYDSKIRLSSGDGTVFISGAATRAPIGEAFVDFEWSSPDGDLTIDLNAASSQKIQIKSIEFFKSKTGILRTESLFDAMAFSGNRNPVIFIPSDQVVRKSFYSVYGYVTSWGGYSPSALDSLGGDFIIEEAL